MQNNQPKYYSELNDHEQVVTTQFYAPVRDGVPLVQNRVWIGLGFFYLINLFKKYFKIFSRSSKPPKTEPVEAGLHGEAD